MTTPTSERRCTTDFRRLTLAVVAVLCAQFALAGHQFEHDDAGATEVCGLCAQLAELEAPPAAVAGVCAVPFRAGTPAAAGPVCEWGDRPPAFHPRAPPGV